MKLIKVKNNNEKPKPKWKTPPSTNIKVGVWIIHPKQWDSSEISIHLMWQAQDNVELIPALIRDYQRGSVVMSPIEI